MRSRPANGGALSIDVLIESPLWKNVPGADAAVRTAISAAATEISSPAGEVAVVLSDDAALRKLNREWRHIDRPTNVLSFPQSAKRDGAMPMLGDIAIAYETLARES